MPAPAPARPSDGHPPGKWAVGTAAAQRVEAGMLLGLGTGSTVAAFLDALQRRLDTGELDGLRGVPTSERTAARGRAMGIELLDPADVDTVDLCIDGADELTPDLVLTKGGGAALLREKVVASLADHFLVIATTDKRVPRLGDSFPIPVEVIPFAIGPVTRALAAHGLPTLRVSSDGQQVRTDNGNAVVDLRVPGGVDDPAGMATLLSAMPGVAEHGLFVELASEALLASDDGDVEVVRPT